MSGLSNYPPNYLIYNDQVTKNLNVVVEIAGAPDYLTTSPLYKAIKYGDPIVYGQPGLVYGGLVPYSNFKTYISMESNLVISQRIEPEQGRGSVSLMSLVLVDIDGYMTQLMAPGIILTEPMGNTLVKIHVGYIQSSFPEDYLKIFQGYISDVQFNQAKCYLQLSDPTLKKRAQVFFTVPSELTSDIDDNPLTTTIPVNDAAGFYVPYKGPNGTYDTAVTCYIKIDDEIMSYDYTGIDTSIPMVNTTSIVVNRAQRQTAIAAHSAGATVSCFVQLQENAIILALKMMLSGWGSTSGFYETGIAISSIVNSGLSLISNALIFPTSVDVVDLYGLTVGDYVTTVGCVNSGNNTTAIINQITSVNGGTNNVIIMNYSYVAENPSTGTCSFRSQYDTLPDACAIQMSPEDVDVGTYQTLYNEFFSQAENTLRFFIDSPVTGKDFIDSEMMLPLGSYSITRYGRCSMTVAKPAIADDKLPILDQNSIVDPNTIRVDRGLNNRNYYDEIQYSYDVDDSGNFQSVTYLIDSTTVTLIDVSTVLPIPSLGLKSILNANTLINRRGQYLLNRYKQCALLYTLSCNWRVGSMVEMGDSVLLVDNGTLKISNFATGQRDIGTQLLEVIDRQLDIKTGKCQLKLLGGLNFQVTDRYGTISPSSNTVNLGSSPTQIKIKDSYGILYPGNEQAKWTQLIGSVINIHSYDFSVQGTTTLIGFSDSDPYLMLVSPALGFTPPDNYIVDIESYPSGTDPLDDYEAKLLYSFLDPTLTVVSGISHTQFTVSSGDVAQMSVGLPVIIHNLSYSVLSPECLVKSISGNMVTLETSLGFIPSGTNLVDLVGFTDAQGGNNAGGPYRIL